MTDFPLPATWDRAGFEAVGFQGFVPLVGLDIDSLPRRRGVYAVFGSQAAEKPAFLEENPITRRKPYTPGKLSMKWLPAQTVVYIGKADAVDGIYGRLGAFSRKSSSHTGGRALWQLENAHDLVAAWVETPDHVAEIVEKSYLRSFRGQYGSFPFANWRL